MENRKFNITEKTTLGELLEILALGEKPAETPKPKDLRETAGEPVAVEERCSVYQNGWAVYDNGSGRTVVWLPECVSFTYQFDKPSYKRESYVPDRESLPEGLLESQPWPVAVTLVGDHRVEENLLNRTGSRRGTKAFADANCDSEFTEEFVSDPVLEVFFRKQGRVAENPEAAYIWKETLHEMLDNMTRGQRRVFVLYYFKGYNQYEIADMLHIKQPSVWELLNNAVKRAKEKL